MFYEWDDNKAELNQRKHGVSFDFVEKFEWDSALVMEDKRVDYGENRFNALGWVNDRLYQLTFTLRDDVIRVISLRKANRREIKNYGQETKS